MPDGRPSGAPALGVRRLPAAAHRQSQPDAQTCAPPGSPPAPRLRPQVGSKLADWSDYYRVLKATDGTTVALRWVAHRDLCERRCWCTTALPTRRRPPACSNFKGKNPVVVFFYPKAATPGCTKEVCKFRDEYQRFVEAGAKVFGISSDRCALRRAPVWPSAAGRQAACVGQPSLAAASPP
jgi:hypothetical protein